MGRRAVRLISRRLKAQVAAGVVLGAVAYVNWQWYAFLDNEANPYVVGRGPASVFGAPHFLPRQSDSNSSGAKDTAAQDPPVMAPGELLGGHPATYYNATPPKESCRLRPPLTRNGRDDETAPLYDVCVVGGGMAGLHTALYLAEQHKLKVLLLEGRRIGIGASGRNGGDAVVGFHTSAKELAGYLRDDKPAEDLFQQSVRAYERIKDLIKRYRIRCDAEEVGSVTLDFARPHVSDAKLAADLAAAQEECNEQLERFGEKLAVWSKTDLEKQGFRSDRFSHGIFNPMNLSLNPLELTLGLARACEESGVTIHEASPVLSVTRWGAWSQSEYQLVQTPIGTAKARHVVIATSSCPAHISRGVSWATLPITTGMMITKPLPKDELDAVFTTKTAIFDARYGLSYFRRVPGDRILFGGTAAAVPQRRNQLCAALIEDLGATFPTLRPYIEVERLWQGKLDTRWPVFPLIGKLSGDVKTSSVWYSVGYAGHGLVPSCAGAIALGEYIATKGQDQRLRPWWRVNTKIPFVRAPGGSETASLWPIGGPWGTPAACIALALITYKDRLLDHSKAIAKKKPSAAAPPPPSLSS